MKRYILIAAAAIVLTALSAFVYGYEYGITPNHIQILPFIEKLKDGALFQGDYFVDTLKRFPSAYPYIMAFISRWMPLEPLHMLLFFIFKFLLLVFAYGLAKQLFNSDRTALITMFLFAFSPLVNAYGLIGHDPLMKTSFYQTSAVAPFTILAISMFLKKRYLAVSLTLAVIYYINGLIGNFLLILFLAAGGASRWLPLFIALMLPGAAWILRLNITEPLKACADFPLYLKLWYAGHYFPSCYTPHQWYHFALISAFFIVFFQKGLSRCAENDKIKRFLYALVAMWIFAYIFADLIPARSVILLQFLRSDVIFIALGIIFGADHIRSFFAGRSLKSAAVGALTILALIEFSVPSYKEFVLAILLLASYETEIKIFLKNISADPQRLFGFLWFLSGIFLVGFSGISFFLYNGSPKMLCMFIFSIALILPARRPGMWFVNTVTAAALTIAACSYIHLYDYRVASREFSNLLDEKAVDWKKLQLWAKDNTPADAGFIAPLELNGFRVFSKRSVFVDWVDGAAMHWKPGFEKVWVDRLKKLGITDILIKNSAPALCGMGTDSGRKSIHRLIYDNLTENDFRRLAKEYGVGYVVRDISRPLSFESAYRNRTFCVYKIR